ncbi:MAG: ribonuclease D [Rickettsiales bacterium]|nr:ribonuclease D [Rickettsiales bacterium]|tara:strand:- start:4 stop:651 length:648 start_codon:yes stop_codon:yes gene_type:complete
MKSLKFNNNEFFIYNNDLPDNLKFGNSIAIDTETTGLSLLRDRLCLVQISSGNGECHIVKFDTNFKKQNSPNLISLLERENLEKIFHFGRFDIAILKKFLSINCKKIFCTKIASRLVRTYTDKHGLREICKELLDIDLNKSQQSSDWSNKELTTNQIKYAASDVLYLSKLKNILTKMLKREKRYNIALKTFEFLDIRTDLDLMGWDKEDIFSHST